MVLITAGGGGGVGSAAAETGGGSGAVKSLGASDWFTAGSKSGANGFG